MILCLAGKHQVSKKIKKKISKLSVESFASLKIHAISVGGHHAPDAAAPAKLPGVFHYWWAIKSAITSTFLSRTRNYGQIAMGKLYSS